MLLLDEDEYDDDAILIVSDDKWEREVHLVKKSGPNFVEMEVFIEK